MFNHKNRKLMKTVIAFVLLFLGAVLMNSPPVMDQDFTVDVDLEMVTSFDMNQDFDIIATLEAPDQGGAILQTYDATWSATLKTDVENQPVMLAKLDGLIYSLGQITTYEKDYNQRLISWVEPTKEGPMRLGLYSTSATWRIHETYM